MQGVLKFKKIRDKGMLTSGWCSWERWNRSGEADKEHKLGHWAQAVEGEWKDY